MNYHRLTREERYQIQAFFVQKTGIREIAQHLGRAPSTISREIKRNRPYGCLYRAGKAIKRAQTQKATIHPRYKIAGDLRTHVVDKLKQGWSPEQISGRLRISGTQISHETIYRFVYRNSGKRDENLFQYLPRRRKKRRNRVTHRRHVLAGKRLHLPWIDDRPSVVDTRSRLGDYERDSIVSPLRQGAGVLTIVDRRSRLTKIAKLPTLDAYCTHRLTVELLRGLPVHTITNDNGPEFSMYDWTSSELKAPVFFSRPYCSWQRGTSENTNGLVRRYFPKGTRFDTVLEEDLKTVEKLLNTRPRKCLGFRTPFEVHNELVGCCTE